MWQLIACRALMGVGAAFIMPSTLSILVNVFPAARARQGHRDLGRDHRRRRRRSDRSPAAGCSGTSGSARSFLVNLPIIALALVGGWFLVPKSKDPEQGALDPVGAVLSIVGISTLVYGLIEAPDKGWAAPVTLGAFAIAVVVLTLFVLWELHVDEPMLDMRFFRNPRVQHRQRRDDARVPRDVRRDVPHDAVLPARARLLARSSPRCGCCPMAPIMIIVAPLTPRLAHALRRQPRRSRSACC